MPQQPRPIRCHLRSLRPIFALTLTIALLAPGLGAQSLDGSRSSLVLQNLGAAEEGFSYLRTASEVEEFARMGLLVKLTGNSDYELAGVSFPYARDEVKRFVERLGHQYRAQCGERLVVTSLTRPITRQPYNASELSVHPTGMAVDLRRSHRTSCRQWLETALLNMESRGVIEATREHWPAHYHVSVFGTPYGRYLASIGDALDAPRVATAESHSSSRRSTAVRARSGKSSSKGKVVRAKSSSRSKSSRTVRAKTMTGKSKGRVVKAKSSSKRYRVGHGDNLWQIAKKHGTSVASLKRANGIRSNRLRPGQVLSIPSKAR